MSKFHIEGDWYIVPDQYSWNLARKAKASKQKADWAEISYHPSPEKALKHYLRLKQLETAGKAGDGELNDLIDTLHAEHERLLPLLCTAFAKICELELEP